MKPEEVEDPPPACDTLAVSADRIKADKGRIAAFCAREIRREARRAIGEVYSSTDPDADKPLNGLEIHQARVAMCLKMVQKMELGAEGAYLPEEEAANFLPAIFLDQNLSRKRKRRAAVHEIAHHLQRTRVAVALYDAETVTCNELEGMQIRHEIARETDAMVSED